MSSAHIPPHPTPPTLLIALSGLIALMTGSGLVLWMIHGPLIFTELVDFALAWCQ